MLKVNNLIGFGGRVSSPSLRNIISGLGLSSNLVLCLDAADPSSYPGTGQTWEDVSGQSNGFFRGAGSGSASDDPTFNGTAGIYTESTYWSFDGTQFFSDDQTGGQTFADTWHQNNGDWSLIFGIYVIGSASTQGLFTSSAFSSGTPTTMSLELDSSERPTYRHVDGNTETCATAATTSSWNFIGASYDEPGTTIYFQTNGTATNNATTAKSSVASTANPYLIGAHGTANARVVNGTRLAFVAGWNANIGATALANLYTAIKAQRLPSAP